MNDAHKKMEQLFGLDQKIGAAQAQLANLTAEVQGVQARRKALSKEIEDEIEHTKAIRKRELTELERIHKETMKGIDAEIAIVRDDKSRLENEKLGIEKEVNVLTDELDHTKLNLARYKTDIKNEADNLKALEATVAALAAQADRYTTQTKPLKQEREELGLELAALRSEKTELVAETNTMRSSYKTVESESERRVQLLAAKEGEYKLKLRGERDYQTKLRDEMATRQLALDEREKVLMRREFKVGQQEENVVRNSGLLNL